MPRHLLSEAAIQAQPLVQLCVVLDTNVVLDWLVFRDPHCAALAHDVYATRLRWVASRAMRDELEHVLTRGALEAWAPDHAVVLACWDRWVVQVEPESVTQLGGLRCTDRDDQKFIDLALQVGAKALLSRDRAVLALARRACKRGLQILSPANWAQGAAA